MTRRHCTARIYAALMTAVLLGAAAEPVAAGATPNTYEECVAKLFRTDSCQSTSWWSDGTCQAKTLGECTIA